VFKDGKRKGGLCASYPILRVYSRDTPFVYPIVCQFSQEERSNSAHTSLLTLTGITTLGRRGSPTHGFLPLKAQGLVTPHCRCWSACSRSSTDVRVYLGGWRVVYTRVGGYHHGRVGGMYREYSYPPWENRRTMRRVTSLTMGE